MVRAGTNDSAEEKKDTQARRNALEKKKQKNGGIAVVWPCDINGCDKQFVREADLKRHQRTTKLHSMPSFACPHCDATFTRADAQRRHQKSRHKGVVLGPSESEEQESSSANGDQPPSESAKIHEPVSNSQPPPGKNNYYRQHTETIGSRPPVFHPAAAQPTRSSTRTWSYPGHWSTNPHYTPSPHYRPSTMRAGYLEVRPSLPPLSSSGTTSSRCSDSPISPPTSPVVPIHVPDDHQFSQTLIHNSAADLTLPINPDLDSVGQDDDKDEVTQADVDLAMDVVMKYAQVQSAMESMQSHDMLVNLNGGSHDGSEETASSSSLANFDDDRENSLPMEDLLHDYASLGQSVHLLDDSHMLHPELLMQHHLVYPSHEGGLDDTLH